MNAFEKLINDVFQIDDFLEDCYIENIHYRCIVSPIVDGVAFSDSGLVDEETYTLDIKLPTFNEIKKGQKVKFREKWYKIDYPEIDSSNTCIKLHIISLSKGIQ